MTAPKQIAGRADELATAATAPSLTPAEQSEAAREAARKAAQFLSSLRRRHRGGRPKKLRYCVYCCEQMGTVELRRHKPHCAARKRPLRPETPWNF